MSNFYFLIEKKLIQKVFIKFIFVGLIICLLICLKGNIVLTYAQEEITSDVIVYEDLQYSDASQKLKMDLFLPEQTKSSYPCVIVIQGGGYRTQDGQRFFPFANYLTKHGFAAALIAYRGLPEYKYRTTIADTKTAIRYIRKISGKYNIDPLRIGAMGGSAGGTLATLLAVTGDIKEFEGEREHLNFSSKIKAAVAYAGISDFIARFTDKRQVAMQPDLKAKIEQIQEWVGSPLSIENEDWLNVSAINHVDKNDAPVLFLHCKNDSTAPWIQSKTMYKKMKDLGIDSEIKIYKNGSHMFHFENFEKVSSKMVKFFNKEL